VVAADRDALKRAVSNLVDNAVRLAPAGSEVRLSAGEEGGWRWLAVVDQGPGIDADGQRHVFERAWSADGASSGLGLAIVRQIVEAHGGVVRLHSDLGRGLALRALAPRPGAARGRLGSAAARPDRRRLRSVPAADARPPRTARAWSGRYPPARVLCMQRTAVSPGHRRAVGLR
jgi:hypothetical protein